MNKKTIIIGVVSILVVALIGAGIFAFNIWQMVSGSEKINGQRDSIPENTTNLPEIVSFDDDWTSWHGPNLSRKSTYKGIKNDWSNGLESVWEANFISQGARTVAWSAAVIKGNHLIIPGRDEENDLVFCLNSQTGELIWQGKYKAETETNHGPGARATPFIDNERVYTFGRSGDLACWQLYNGKILWKKNITSEGAEEPIWGHSSSPLVYKDKVYIQGGGTAVAMAYNKMTGDLVWKSMEGSAGYAPPTLFYSDTDTSILFFHGTGLSALNPENGKEIWTVEHLTDYFVNASLPQILDNKIFITSAYGAGSQMIEVNNNSAKSKWSSLVLEGQHTDPVIVDGFVYGYSGDSGKNKGQLKCVQLSDGKEMWSTDEVGNGTLIYADGHLICLDLKGNLYLVAAKSDKYEKVTEMKNAIPDVKKLSWTSPVLANGKLYLKYMQKIICYQL